MANSYVPPDEQLESVLGATPHEFESRILRRSEGPHQRMVRALCVFRLICSLIRLARDPPAGPASRCHHLHPELDIDPLMEKLFPESSPTWYTMSSGIDNAPLG